MNVCWCGNDDLVEYSSDYYLCNKCHTLVTKASFDSLIYQIDDEEHDLYGKNYWEKTMLKEAGVNSLGEIIDLYLKERAVYWLEYLLRYLPFNGKVAEVGCGLGQLAYLMKQLEYRQKAYELSPDICKYVKKELGIDIVCTPFAEEKRKFDSVIALDVVEHILDPRTFIGNCVEHLEINGVLCIQTPCFDAALSYEEMLQMKPRFRDLLVKEQHIYLYSKVALEELLKEAGLGYIEFQPAFFGDDYDMFLFASRKPLVRHSDEKIDDFLNGTKNGRLIKSIITMQGENREMASRFQLAEQNSTARMEQIERLNLLLKNSEADRESRLEQIEILTKHLKESEADREARGEQIEILTKHLKESEADRGARGEQIEILTKHLKESEVDREARGEQIEILTKHLKESEADREARGEQIEALTKMLKDSEADRDARMEQIITLTKMVEDNQSGSTEIQEN